MSESFHSFSSYAGSSSNSSSSCGKSSCTSSCCTDLLSTGVYTVPVRRRSAASGPCCPLPRVTSLPVEACTQEGGQESGGCGCCKTSFRDALKLLCSSQLSSLVDFNKFAFLTASTAVGAQPQGMSQQTGPQDDLGTLSGSFRRFSPGTCDLIDISGTAVSPFGTLMSVSQASLCALTALVFETKQAESAEGGYTQEEVTQFRFRRAKELIQCQLEQTDPCGVCTCNCRCTDDCCCTASVLDSLSGSSLNKQTTLTAGLLALQDVSVLGSVGNVLVLANESARRFYFVCTDKVEFLA